MEQDFFQLMPFTLNDLLLVVKGFYLLALFLYILFAGIVIRQVQMMMTSLKGVLKLPLNLIAWLHFFATLVVFIMAIVLL
jgi:hypothetical protein